MGGTMGGATLGLSYESIFHKPRDRWSGHTLGRTQNYNYQVLDYKGLKNHKIFRNYYVAAVNKIFKPV